MFSTASLYWYANAYKGNEYEIPFLVPNLAHANERFGIASTIIY